MGMAISAVALLLAGLPAVLFLLNRRLFRPLAPAHGTGRPSISVLIPARNEELSIGAAVESVLENHDVELEVIVLDDNSEDDTQGVVRTLAAQDSRIRLVCGTPLPTGWCGKQHACHLLAQHASHEYLCFLDADVRLAPDALSRMAAFAERSGAALISGFPRQVVVTFGERLLLPLMHYVLLGFLPIARLRASTSPAFAAGCGQLMFVRRGAYTAAGGHAAIRSSLHDGILLPRAFRRAGFATDIFDATDLARCRMYRSAREVLLGLAKNAVEGLGAPSRILLFTALLLGGSVLPFLALAFALANGDRLALATSVGAIALAYLPRLLAIRQFHQPHDSAWLHPFGILVLMTIQWYALTRHLLGHPAAWKGRAYGSTVTGSSSRR